MTRYLQNHQGIFYFRRKVPKNLVKEIGLVEVKRSLGTGNKRVAKIRAAELFLLSEKIFERANMSTINFLPTLNHLARIMFVNDIDYWEAELASREKDDGRRNSITVGVMTMALEEEQKRPFENDFEVREFHVRAYLEREKMDALLTDDPDMRYLRDRLVRLAQRGQIASLSVVI